MSFIEAGAWFVRFTKRDNIVSEDNTSEPTSSNLTNVDTFIQKQQLDEEFLKGGNKNTQKINSDCRMHKKS